MNAGKTGAVPQMIAYAFQSDLTLAAMLKALTGGGSWQWRGRESAWYGEYISASADSGLALIRVFEEEDRFVIDLHYKKDGPQARQGWDRLRETVVRDVLPTLAAREIEETEPNDLPLSWLGPSSA